MSSPNEFDIEYWLFVFSRTEIPKLHQVVFSDSPISIVAIDRFRDIASELDDLGPSVPTDRLVLAKGEPDTRHTTKVGGVPYRPAGRPWPSDPDGRPMEFLLQFCFADSHDHVSELPGDVLVVFVQSIELPAHLRGAGKRKAYVASGEPECLAFEWYPVGLDNLVSPGDLSPTCIDLPISYGVRHRSVDFLDADKNVDVFERVIDASTLPENQFRRNATVRAISCQEGMKIGGMPYVWSPGEAETSDGQFLASFSGVRPCAGFPYPWTNQRQAMSTTDWFSRENHFIICDGCCINFYLTSNGEVDWRPEFL